MKVKLGYYVEIVELAEGEQDLAKHLLADLQEYATRRLRKLRRQNTRVVPVIGGEDRKQLEAMAGKRRSRALFLEQTAEAFTEAQTIRGAAKILKITPEAAYQRMKAYGAKGYMKSNYPWG